MTDRELLELAANADGRKWKWVTCPRYAGEVPGMLSHDAAHGVDYFNGWNPLEDDGDAMRLAVKLHLNVNVYETRTTTTADGFFGEVFHQGDKYVATRRAIVRAAAEIGKEME